MFDLKTFREDSLRLTQKELAILIDERQDKISRLEKNPNTIGLDLLIKIADKTGTTLDELVQYKKKLPEPIVIDDTWDMVNVVKQTINDYIETSLKTKLTNIQHRLLASEVKELTEKLLTKPKVAVVGLSDTGKSTLINGLLGAENMPAAWTPKTAISIYIKHVNDRPAYINEDVWFFKTQLSQDIGWDPMRLKDQTYTTNWLAKKGHLHDLNEFAVRRESDDGQIGSAVVFIDSPILKVCDIVDLPGYNTGDRELDNTLNEQVRAYADVLIYMSLANGFMRANDIEYIKSHLSCLPVIEHGELNNRPLGNLYVIASQAHVVDKGNHEHLNMILDDGAKRLYTLIPKEVWDARSEITGMTYSSKVLRSRFFTYTKDIEDLRTTFEIEVTKLIENYPTLLIDQYKKACDYLCIMHKSELQMDLKRIHDMIEHKDRYVKLVHGLGSRELTIREASERLSVTLLNKVETLKTVAEADFLDAYEQLISVDSVISIIDREGYTNVRADMEQLGSLLNSKLQIKTQNILKNRSLELCQSINDYLDGYEELVNELFTHSSLKPDYKPKRVFAEGIKGDSNIAGLAVWGASLGDMMAYSIIGKEVKVLSVLLPYSVAGAPGNTFSKQGLVAYAGGTIAMQGGVIGLGVGLAILAATSAMAVFGSGWKKSAGKKIVAAFTNEHVYEVYDSALGTYWSDTEKAFKVASAALENDCLNEIEKFESQVNYDVRQLESSIVEVVHAIDFYEQMPWIEG